MRKLLIFLFGAALIFGSLYVLYLQFFVSTVIRGTTLMGAGFCLTMGFYLLWDDFIAPFFNRKSGEP